ncbi:MAG: hypothetical protein ACI84O_000461 [Myxococcota bacterium]|jgi:hypothetical protein
MVLGVNGSTMPGAMLDFDMNDYGEAFNDMDGVHVSSDGIAWHAVLIGWNGGLEHIDIGLSAGGPPPPPILTYSIAGLVAGQVATFK